MLQLQSHAPRLGCFGQHTLRLVIEAVVLEAGQRSKEEREVSMGGRADFESSWKGRKQEQVRRKERAFK